MPIVGIGEVARAINRDPKVIRRAVEDGRISRRPDGLFDLDQAVTDWKNNTVHGKGPERRGNVVEMAGDQPVVESAGIRSTDYNKARAFNQLYAARLLKLRYEERAKTLVPARDVEDAAVKQMTCIKEACMNIPARLAAQLAVETDQNRCYMLLEDAIVAVFTDYAEGRIQ